MLIAEIIAENAWYLETDRLEYNRLIELWKIEKTRAVEVATLEDQYRRITHNNRYGYPNDYSAETLAIAAATTEKIAKADAAWSKSQIAIDDTYIDAISNAMEAELEAYDKADESYNKSVETAYKAYQSASERVSEQYAPTYITNQQTLETSQKTAWKAYLDAYYASYVDEDVTAALSDAFADDPGSAEALWVESQLWLKDAANSLWQSLGQTVMENLDTLSSLYTSVNDALFALLGSDEDALADFATTFVSNPNPFIVYEAANITALATYLWNAGQIVTNYQESLTEIESENAAANSDLTFTYYNTTQDAIDDYTTTNTQANNDAAEGSELINTVYQTQPTGSNNSTTSPSIDPKTNATTINASSNGQTIPPDIDEYLILKYRLEMIDKDLSFGRGLEIKKQMEQVWESVRLEREYEEALARYNEIEEPEPAEIANEVSVKDIDTLLQHGMAIKYLGKDYSRQINNGLFGPVYRFFSSYSDVVVVKIPLEDGNVLALVYEYMRTIPGAAIGTGANMQHIPGKEAHYVLRETAVVTINSTNPREKEAGFYHYLADNVWKGNQESTEAALTFIVNLWPFGATIDSFQQGKTGEGLWHLAGDATMVIGIGFLDKAAKGGKTAQTVVKWAIRAEKVMAGADALEAVTALYYGDNIKAAGAAGSALMRVLGVKYTQLELMRKKSAALKEVNNTAKKLAKTTPPLDMDLIKTHNEEQLYEIIRNQVGDVERIARNTGYKVENIQKIKNHVFYEEHLMDRLVQQGVPAEWTRFDPDKNMAAAWIRLENGIHTQDDLRWLYHEMAEAGYMRRHGPSYDAAHEAARIRFPSPY